MAQRSLLLICVLLPCVVDASPVVPRPPDCWDAVERGASTRLFALKVEISRQNSLSTTEFDKIRAALNAVKSHADEPSVRSCLKNFSKRERYFNWYQRFARSVTQEARTRLNRVCTRKTRQIISGGKSGIERALADKRFALAAKRAFLLEQELAQPLAKECEATAVEVAELTGRFIPEVKAQAARPNVMRGMSSSYAAVAQPFAQALQALKSRPPNMSATPSQFVDANGQEEFESQVAQCLKYAASLGEMGVADDEPIANTETPESSVSIVHARDQCEYFGRVAKELFSKATAHNAEVERLRLAKWKRISIKGWDMEATYNERGRPMSEAVQGATIVWTFAGGDTTSGECKTYRFSSRGKLRSRTTVACPTVASR